MTDIELIVLAAKAAGIQGHVSEGAAEFNFWLTKPDSFGRTWSPLTDDGDALRLTVKLQMGVSVFKDYAEATDGIRVDATETVHDLPDIYAATRRAIVRAAAEIGKAMS